MALLPIRLLAVQHSSECSATAKDMLIRPSGTYDGQANGQTATSYEARHVH